MRDASLEWLAGSHADGQTLGRITGCRAPLGFGRLLGAMIRPGPRALSRLLFFSVVALVGACSAFMPEIGALRRGRRRGGPGRATHSLRTPRPGPDSDASRFARRLWPTTFTVLVGPGDSHTFSPPAARHPRWGHGALGLGGLGPHRDERQRRQRRRPLLLAERRRCAGAPTSVQGATYDHRFTTAGTFPYFCRPHVGAGMIGSVTVR